MNKQRLQRIPLVLMGILTLLAAIWGGLQRIGWDLPIFNLALPLSHGQLMIGGFLGTVIGIERAVAHKKIWSIFGPLFTGIGSLLIILDISNSMGAMMITSGSMILVMMFIVFLKSFASFHMNVMAAGALFWFVGNIFWLSGFAIPNVMMWWTGFLVLTISGERLELSRLLTITPKKKIHFLFGISLFVIGVILTTFRFELGMQVSGFGMLVLAIWLLFYDMARKTIRQDGLSRFIAVALILGYIWLGFSGFLAFFNAGQQAGPLYDAIVHSVLIGFVFSMILGHAPIIFPAILKVQMAFRFTHYIPLLLLHLSLVLRVVADLSGWLDGRLWGGMLNGIAILLFFINTITSVSKRNS